MTSQFQPPPTWALPILVDEKTKLAIFNPVWLKWFVDLSANLGGSSVSTATITGGTSTSGVSTAQTIELTGDVTSLPTLLTNGTVVTTLAAPYITSISVTSPLTSTGGATPSLGIVNQGTTTTLLHGNAGGNATFGAVVEADISLSNNTTNDATAARHGFLPTLSNVATQFLNGQGAYTTPSGTAASYSLTSFAAVTTKNVIHNFGTYPIVQVIDNTAAVILPLTITHNTVNDFTVTFTLATTGNIIASVGSPQPQAVTVVATDYTVLTTDRIVKITAAAKTITLPTSVGNTGREFLINNASTGNCFVVGTGGETINASATQLLPSYSSMVVYADGSNYWIV